VPLEIEKNVTNMSEEKIGDISEEKNKKYHSKRKKRISRFLQDSTIALYNPKQSFEEESKETTSKTKKNKKQSLDKLEPKTKKRISIKEYYLKNNLLMEENLDEQFCICRFFILIKIKFFVSIEKAMMDSHLCFNVICVANGFMVNVFLSR
jgi:hypothetical protein